MPLTDRHCSTASCEGTDGAVLVSECAFNYQELLSIAEKLQERNYFITSTFAGEDCLFHQDSEEADMEYFLTMYREPKKK